MRTTISRCGQPRWRGVRVLEALVLLGEEEIDRVMVSEENGSGDIIGMACDLFWEMEWCSGLHQSVANMVVHILEGENKRHYLQHYLINKYNILQYFMKAFKKNEEMVQKTNFRLGYMGHVIIMCQALEHVEHNKESEINEDINHDAKDVILACRSNDDVEMVEMTEMGNTTTKDDDEDCMDDKVNDEVGDILDGKEEQEDEPHSLSAEIQSNAYSGSDGENDTLPPVLCEEAISTSSHGENKTEVENVDSNFEKDFVSHDMRNASVITDYVPPSVEQNDDTSNFEKDFVSSKVGLMAQAIATPIPVDDSNDISQGPPSEERIPPKHLETLTPSPTTPDSKCSHPSSEIISILKSHSLYTSWCEFLSTVLAADTLIQSTHLGGTHSEKSGHDCINQANAFDDFEDTDTDVLSAGIPGDDFDVSDNLLDIAASMMEGIYVSNKMGTSMLGTGPDEDITSQLISGNYLFDDPLGRRQDDEVFESSGEHVDKGDSDTVNDLNSDEDVVPVINFYVGNFGIGNQSNDQKKVKTDTGTNDNSDDKDSDDDDIILANREGGMEDTSWTNFPEAKFADFESVVIENSNEDHNPVLSETANSSSETIDDAFFVADFSAFPTNADVEKSDEKNAFSWVDPNGVIGEGTGENESEGGVNEVLSNGHSSHKTLESEDDPTLNSSEDVTAETNTDCKEKEPPIPFGAGDDGFVRTNIDELF